MPRIPSPVGLLLIALLLATVFLLSLPGRTLWARVLQDAGHGPVFACIAIVLLLMRPAGRAERVATGRSFADYRHAFWIAVALGVASELLQYFLPDRNVSVVDVWHDVAGALLGLSTVALFGSGRRRDKTETIPRDVAVAVALGAFVVLAWEPLHCARAYAQRSAAFPTLAPTGPLADRAFVETRDAMLTREPLPAAFGRAGEDGIPALRMNFVSGARPAFAMTEASPDWRGYSVLALDVTNPGSQAAHFILRVLDSEHDWSHEDRLNLPVVVPPRTRTTVRVSLDAVRNAPERRPMDLSAIADVTLFATRPLHDPSFYVSRVWLE